MKGGQGVRNKIKNEDRVKNNTPTFEDENDRSQK